MADNAFKNIRSYRKYIFVALGIVIGGILALAVGSVSIPPRKVFKILFSRLLFLAGKILGDWTPTDETIVLQLRFPRIILAFLVGAELSAESYIPGVFRNPWPTLYNRCSSGASLGASLGILFFPGMRF